MEAYFDKKGDVLNAHIRVPRDDSIIYTVKTTFGLRGRKITLLRDENPVGGATVQNSSFAAASSSSRRRGSNGGGVGVTVGYINWKDKTLDVGGVKRKVRDVKRTEGKFWKRSHFWKWSLDHKREYQIEHHTDGWKATVDNNTSIAASFSVPLRPQLFGKTDPPVLHLTKTALEQDEVFLILAFIYAEVRRQDKTNSSSAHGNVGW